MSALVIRLGSFFFRHRNNVFPIVVLAVFAFARPPQEVFGSEALEHTKDVLALLLGIAGLCVRASVIGFAYIKRGGKGKRVYAADLVTAGMFGICRNPLYVGNLLICLATFLMHGDPIVMAVGISFYVFVYVAIIFTEEAYLSERFGLAYQAYCAEVPRFLPKFSRWSEATAGMSFNVRRVLAKDYSTIGSTIALLAATEAYEDLRPLPVSFAELWHLAFLVAAILSCGIFVAVVKSLKSRGILVEG